MSRRDAYHDLVRRLLEADGWTITHDPLNLTFGELSVQVDLGAESPLAAEKAGRQIAVEVKNFLGVSGVTELQRALGQYGLYATLLETQYPGRPLYLAMPARAYNELLNTLDGQRVIRRLNVNLILFDQATEVIVRWIEPNSTES
jgi:hypothetical protein